MPVHPRAVAGQTALSSVFNAVVDTVDQLTAFTAAKVASYAIVNADRAVPADCSGGPFTITLPSAVTAGAGRFFHIPKIDVSANALTIATVSGQTIDGLASIALYGRVSVSLMSDGANWIVIQGHRFINPDAFNVRWFGVTGDGATDDSAGLRTVIAVAALLKRTVHLLDGTYLVSADGASAWALDIPSDVTITGDGVGSVLRLAASQANFTRLLNIQNESNVTIRHLRLDGNKAGNNATYEQNHCIFVYDSEDVTIEDVELVDGTGDGVYIGGTATGSERVHLNRVKATGHLRNSVTVGEANDTWITNSYLICDASSGGQAVDSEPNNGVNLGRMYVVGNVLGHESTADDAYAITLSGKGTNQRRSGIYVIGNEFRGGGIHGAWFDTAIIANNTGTISRVLFQRRHHDVILDKNIWEATASAGVSAFRSESNSATDFGERVRLRDNLLYVPNGTGLSFSGITSARVEGGTIRGNNVASSTGIAMSATVSNVSDLVIDGVGIFDFTQAGISLSRSSTWTMDRVRISRYNIKSTSITYGIDLTSTDYITDLTIGEGLISGATQRLRIGTGTPYLESGMAGNGGTWNVFGTPEGALTEVVGALAKRRNGGAGTSVYVKESGTGNTGWVAK